MATSPITLFYDYVDPASFLQMRVLEELLPPEQALQWHPFEIQPPPRPMIDPNDQGWRGYWESMIELGRGLGLEMTLPTLTPWSRKAHELALHAREKDAFPRVHRALFRAHLLHGRDLGRVDVLVEVARDQGLEPTEAKATLDVDRFLSRVIELRNEAERLGVRGVPTLLSGERKLEGFHDVAAVTSFLESF